MVKQLELRLSPQEAYDPAGLRRAVGRELGLSDGSRLSGVVTVRRSIDARQRRVAVNVTVQAYIDEEPPTSLLKPVDFRPLPADAPQAVVVGAGPAGLFAALELIRLGWRPVVLERGKDVDSRRLDMARISREGEVDPDSNYCFGEGGAGAFSDGKLFTRSKKRGNVEGVLHLLCQHGADERILVEAHPHIGSDRLPAIIRNIRLTIERCGGQVCFGTRVAALSMAGEDVKRVTGVVTADGSRIDGPVILATGHSARDVYRMLADSGIGLEAKGIAVGVRLEHPQHLIDCLRYHSREGRGRWLPPAEYTMLTRVDGRAVYSFCMCPGGVVVPAASAPGELVVNGMSPSTRGTRWANSGMVVEVLPEDVPGDNPMRMAEFQAGIEHAFYADARSTLNAPAQLMTDFCDGRDSVELPRTSYAPGVHPARVDRLLPEGVSRRLQEGFRQFGRKQPGFLTSEAMLIGCETRTSSPVRVPRDSDTLQAAGIAGLYPAGEGAGYAGGIVSAAIDGQRCAAALAGALS